MGSRERRSAKRALLRTRSAGCRQVEALERRTLLSAGALIDTFGNHGVVSVAGGTQVASAAQSDGKIVAVSAYGRLYRFNTDGSLDQSFGGGGVIQIGVPQQTAEFDDVAVQKDGSIVVAGSMTGFFTNIAMFRFTAAGFPDTSLNNGQSFVEPGGPLGTIGTAKFIKIQSDGKIVLGGVAYDNNAFLSRLNTDGTLDDTFGVNGWINFTNPGTISGMALDSNSQIVIDGLIGGAPSVMRLLPTGDSDSFGEGGRAMIASSDFGAPIVRADNSILIPIIHGDGFNNMGVEAFTSSGLVDTSFGANGIAGVPFYAESHVICGALQPNGVVDVALAGPITNGNEIDVARFNSQGVLDSSFGISGRGLAYYPDPVVLHSVLFTNDGRITTVGNDNAVIVLAAFDAATATGSISGTVFNDANGNNQREGTEVGLSGRTVFLDANQNERLDPGETSTLTDATGHYSFGVLVGQYTVRSVQPAGWKSPLIFPQQTVVTQSQTTVVNLASSKTGTAMPVDATFGSGGVVRISQNGPEGGMARQSDGKLLLIGANTIGRYTTAGVLDKSFGVNGWANNPIPDSDLDALAVQSDGKIVFAGTKALTPIGSSYGVVLGRLNSDGSPDKTYGTGGILTTSLANVAAGLQLVVRTDNSAIVTSFSYGLTGGFNLALIKPTGQIDSTFGTGGYVVLNIDKTSIQAVALTSTNAILLAGTATDGLKTDGVVMRLTPAGKVDPTFGTGGKVLTVASTAVTWSALTVTTDGKVVAAGLENFHFAAARFSSSGSVDSSFGTGGVAVALAPITTAGIFGPAVDFVGQTSDGGFVLAGSVGHTAYKIFDFGVALFTNAGKLDTRFGHGGEAWAGFSAGSDNVHAALLQPDGKLVMVGDTESGPTALVRITLPSTAPVSATISGTIYADNNGNAKRDTGETAVSGRKVYVDKNKNGVLDTGEPTFTTGANGIFTFTGLAAGTYRILDVLPAGWRRTLPSAGYYDLTVTAGQTLTGKDFAETTRGVISGTIFNDTNGNAIKDSTEAAVSGRVVFIDTNKNGKLDAGELSMTTGTDGKYSFVVPAGTYRVRDVLPAGWRRTLPTAGYYDVTLASGQTIIGKNFAETTRGVISGMVFKDTNANTIKDSTEIALSGWVVFLDTNNNGKLDSGEQSLTTGTDGKFSFVVPAGTYHLRETLKSGFKRTTPATGVYTITLTSGQVITGKNFGDQ